ncbi:MAG: hypothetical protein LBR47_00350 [Spirochaetaceae bacterium]|jgi:hypothetical protein|nr:hypothetical protein [Spirochaetaceae bacterium]
MPERILKWREALTTLPDHHFFELMRMYLGEIRTPFNKQKLIEELGAFLHRPENREALIRLLDDMDLLVLAAVRALSVPTQEKLVKLFSGTFPFAVLYERLLNMEERLILFRIREDGESVFHINPYIFDDVEPYTGISLLLPVTAPPDSGPLRFSSPFPDDLTLGSLLPFFMHTKDAVKNDGVLKKRIGTVIRDVFPSLLESQDVPRLIDSLKNLLLLRQQQFSLVPDIGRWYSFAGVSPRDRYLYLAAAACGHGTREALVQNARLILDIVFSLPETGGFTESALYRSAFIQRERWSPRDHTGRPFRQGRFAALLEKEALLGEPASKEMTSLEAGAVPGSGGGNPAEGDLLVENAIAFGLIVKRGDLYYRNPFFTAGAGGTPESVPAESAPGYLHVDGGFSVTIFPGLPLGALLDVLVFLEVLSVDTAGRFELTKRSCLSGFDCGFTPDEIISRLEKKSSHSLPQNIVFSINEWYTGFTAVSLYHGYVVQAEESRRVVIENSGLIAPRIRKILAPGIYLLDFASHEEAVAAFRMAGIDSLGTVNSALPQEGVPGRGSAGILPPLPVRSFAGVDPEPVPRKPGGEEIISSLYRAVDAMKLPGDQAEALRSRISRKVVLSPVQLRPESVRFEQVEAGGMDFLGKVRVVEHAIASASLVELSYDDNSRDGNPRDSNPGRRVLLGSPVKIEKREGDSFLKLITEPEGRSENVSIGKASTVKRIRGSVFKERS